MVCKDHRGLVWISALAATTLWAPPPTYSQGVNTRVSTADLKKLSVEELLDTEVTSVSRTEETLRDAAAAITVISNDDLRRSGAANVPEALRGIPGIFVGTHTANSWAISARGFTSVNSEKLLVLSDTRSIYTPLYSGVFWGVQDYLLEDIERIEVIRGPGASLWGSNAVNGVINITTKKAQDTQGTYLEASAGNEDRAMVAARYGGQSGNGIGYRVFGQYVDHDQTFNTTADTSDDWRLAHLGFRADWNSTEHDSLTVQGDVYDGTLGQLAPSINVIGRPGPTGDLNIEVSGGNVLGRWQHRFSPGSDLQLRLYYDRTHRDDASFRDDLDTVDVDIQHRFALGASQEIIWGLSDRFTSNRNVGKGIFAVEPASSDDNLVSGFVQDQIGITDALRLTVGTKLEDNDFSGFEWQPSARLAWDLNLRQTFWAAISRAVRVPTRLERDIAVDVSDPAGNPVFRLLGNEAFASEKLLAYELGYRWQARPDLFFDLAAFDNHYHDLASLEVGTPFVDPADGRIIVPIVNQNLTDGRAQGFEALASYSPRTDWQLSASYSYLNLNLHPSGLDLNRGEFLEGATPKHQFGLRSYLNLSRRFSCDTQFRYLSAIRSIPDIVDGSGIGAYAELDVRLAWQLSRHAEVSLVGQNLLHDHHPEFGTPAARGEEQRSVLGRVVLRY